MFPNLLSSSWPSDVMPTPCRSGKGLWLLLFDGRVWSSNLLSRFVCYWPVSAFCLELESTQMWNKQQQLKKIYFTVLELLQNILIERLFPSCGEKHHEEEKYTHTLMRSEAGPRLYYAGANVRIWYREILHLYLSAQWVEAWWVAILWGLARWH